jgi:antitoxin component YwqK of YwqJK toxin-antitoxin module
MVLDRTDKYEGPRILEPKHRSRNEENPLVLRSPSSSPLRRSSRSVPFVVLLLVFLLASCSDPDKERIKETTKPTYDKTTGKLTELTYDRNKNGKIDTWTDMDGTKPLRSRIDLDEDGKIDRWEYYDDKGALLKVGFSRKNDGVADAWAFSRADGTVARIEISSKGDEKKLDRWEWYEGGALVRAEEDTNGDGRPDKWETYEAGAVKTAALDENGDGRPDRRLTYAAGALVLIESDPDPSGAFRKRVPVR